MGVDPTVSQCEIGSVTQLSYGSRFQPGEGPSRGLLRDYKPSDGTFWSPTAHHFALNCGNQSSFEFHRVEQWCCIAEYYHKILTTLIALTFVIMLWSSVLCCPTLSTTGLNFLPFKNILILPPNSKNVPPCIWLLITHSECIPQTITAATQKLFSQHFNNENYPEASKNDL